MKCRTSRTYRGPSGRAFLSALVFSVWLISFSSGCGPPYIGPTEHPIVMAHGMGGWSSFLGYEYFFDVEDYLEAAGLEVYSPAVSPINSIEVRAEELKAAIDERYPAGKVNIIGHSMGGMDSRHMITHLGMADRVASLTTIASPHHGTSICDIAVGLLPGVTEEIIDFLLNIVGLDWEGVRQITVAYIEEEFNPTTPDAPEVAYFSYGGNGSLILSPLLIVSYLALFPWEGPNDGLCSTYSANWGTYLGDIDADHLDEIGQIAGITEFDWKNFYLAHCAFLKGGGF